MSGRLEIREATFEERQQIYANVFDFWQWADTVEEHVRLRLESVQHQRARWYGGFLEGKLVSSLGAYPIQFVLDGVETLGISIGSVHTLEAYRGRGLVPQLMKRVEELEAERGAHLSILYSDIDPKYYARQGYQQCPSRQLTLTIPSEATSSASTFTLSPLDPIANRSTIERNYELCIHQEDLGILRSADYWDYIFEKSKDDSFHELLWDDESVGYVLVGTDDGCLNIRDYATTKSPTIENWLPAICELARSKKLGEVGGWLPACETAPDSYKDRPTEITMIKHLATSNVIEHRHLDACDAFREIDHV